MRLTLFLLWAGLCVQQATRGDEPFGRAVRVKTDDGAELNCIVAGPENPALAPIVFVPGYLMPAEIFDLQLRHFATQHRVVGIDPRSQGKSSRVTYGHNSPRRARDIKEVADQLRLTKFVLVGWSLGVMDALSFYEQFSAERLGALVFIDGDLSYEVPDADAIREIHFLKQVAGMTQINRSEALRGFVRSMYHNPPAPGYLDRITASVLSTSEDTSLAILVNRIGFTFKPGLEKISVPVLVVVSDQNPSRDQILSRAREIPKSELHSMKETGHALFVDKPAEFNGLLETFLGRIDKAESKK
jgi:microsomal epoxide hydrolase